MLFWKPLFAKCLQCVKKATGEVEKNAVADGFFFYLGFVSRRFTNHRTAREEGGHSINSSLPLPPASQTLRH